MAIASLFGVVALPIILIGVLLPVALVVALQVWLCKRKNRWLGLILPGLVGDARLGERRVNGVYIIRERFALFACDFDSMGSYGSQSVNCE